MYYLGMIEITGPNPAQGFSFRLTELSSTISISLQAIGRILDKHIPTYQNLKTIS